MSRWTPLWPQIEPRLSAAQPKRFRWPSPTGDGWIGPIHSPLREDRHPSFSVLPDSESTPGAFKDHTTNEHGSIADLARLLGVELPGSRVKVQAPEPTLTSFLMTRRLRSETLEAFEVKRSRHKGRPALRYPTALGIDRIKYLDGRKPKYGWVDRGGAAHWYRLRDDLTATGGTLYLVNGEPSVWACFQAGVSAVCLCAGESTVPSSEQVRELSDAGAKSVRVVYDRDETGRTGAHRVVESLRAGNLDAAALELPPDLPEGGDVDDLHRKVGDRLGEVLTGLPELGDPADPLAALQGLSKESDLDEIEAALRGLGNQPAGDDLSRAILREKVVAFLKRSTNLSSPARVVDAVLGSPTPCENLSTVTAEVIQPDPEPWPQPVPGTALLDELVAALARFLVLPDGAADAVALWVLHAHAHDSAAISPLLCIGSPEKRCGKTTLLNLVNALVPRALPASSITAASMFRVVEKYRPTLLVDEADTFIIDNDDLRGVLNCGHNRLSAYVVRTVGDSHEPAKFSTWAPKAIALIGKLPSTLEDRSVLIPMRRRTPNEKVERLRLDRLQELEPLRQKAARWVADHMEVLRTADPAIPDTLHDRAADNWRHLLAIADAAGDEWAQRARDAALVLSGNGEPAGESRGVLLLGDLRKLFSVRRATRLGTEEIVIALTDMEERPWPELRRGKPITGRQLAALLQPFNISPRQIRIGDRKTRGYQLEDFNDAFTRYLPQPSGTDGTSLKRNDLAHQKSGTPDLCVPHGARSKPLFINDVPDVPDGKPSSRPLHA